MDRANILLKVEKRDARGIRALAQMLEGKLAEEGVLCCLTPEGIQITLLDMILLNLQVQEMEQLGARRSLDMELEWIEEDPSLGSVRLSE